MKLVVKSALSLALLLPVASFAVEAPAVKPGFVGQATAHVVNFAHSVRAKLPAMPSKEQAVAAVKGAPKAAYEFAKAHPYKSAAIVAGTAAVVYAVYKVCTAKKAKTAKTK